MSATIAVVDDEPHLLEAVVEYLQGHGFRVLGAGDAAAFRAQLAAEPIDLVILDINMPGEDGLSLARWLRKHSAAGIIFATAAGMTIDRIVGLELGADDYLVKPYELRELLARIRSILRRVKESPVARTAERPAATAASRGNVGGQRLQFGGFVLDLDGRRLTDEAGTLIDLTPLEFDLLETMATRPNRVLSRAQLIEQSGDGGDGGDERRIDIRITRLRKKIEPDPDRPRFIKTVRGEGYVFVPEAG